MLLTLAFFAQAQVCITWKVVGRPCNGVETNSLGQSSDSLPKFALNDVHNTQIGPSLDLIGASLITCCSISADPASQTGRKEILSG